MKQVPESLVRLLGGEEVGHAKVLLYRGRGLARDSRTGEEAKTLCSHSSHFQPNI